MIERKIIVGLFGLLQFLSIHARADSVVGDIGLKAVVSNAIELPEGRGRFNTSFSGVGRFVFDDQDSAEFFSFSCVGQDTTLHGEVVELRSDCELRDSEESALYLKFSPADSSFSVLGGEGRWSAAKGKLSVEYHPAPTQIDGELWFFSTLSGEVEYGN